MMRKFFTSVFILLFSSCLSHIYSQALYEVNIEEKIKNATLIVEGKVIDQQSFWNPKHTMIYTSNKVKLYKAFKGTASAETIEIMTVGGTVGMEGVEASDLLTLDKGNIGVFFCFENSINLISPYTGNKLYDVYSSSQGAFTYDLNVKTASAPFVRYSSIENQLYKELVQLIGHKPTILDPSFDITTQSRPQTPLGPIISSFSPLAVNAGASLDPVTHILTINGSGFGSTAGGMAAVLFDDANNGTGGTPFEVLSNSSLVQSWTDNQIKIKVPTRAGTGTFDVRDELGVVTTSPDILTVNYSVITFSYFGGSMIKELNMMNTNGNGGYTVSFSSAVLGGGVDLNAAPEKVTFLRALNTWKEVVGFNVTEGGASVNQAIALDGENLVLFDNLNTGVAPLSAGVLASCYSYSNPLCNPSVEAEKPEFDIVIRNTGVSAGTTSFTSGPCPPLTRFFQIDLETVLLHELGHAINLGHVNDRPEGFVLPNVNPAKLMHYQVLNGVSRKSPDLAAFTGALYCINPQSNSYGTCGLPAIEMTPLTRTVAAFDECPVSFPSVSTPANTVINFDLVHTTSNKNGDPMYTSVTCDGIGTAVTNNAYYAIKTNSSGNNLTLAVSGYGTLPASVQSSCIGTGIRYALYQVNSCPVGQSFPSPIACGTFDGDGVLPAITGLAANTNYLIYLDGIDNTKANFRLTVNPGVLPVTLVDFRGNISNNTVNLFWKTSSEFNCKEFYVEKSIDGILFNDFAVVAAKGTSNIETNYSISDDKPYSGVTFYRLKIVDKDGRFQYSDVVRINTPKKEIVVSKIYPNPTSGKINLQIISGKRETLSVEVFDIVGKSMAIFNVPVEQGINEKPVYLKGLVPGTYMLQIKDELGSVIEKSKFLKY